MSTKPLRQSDMRVRILLQRVELIATEVATLAYSMDIDNDDGIQDIADEVIESIMQHTKPLRNPAGVNRLDYQRLRKEIEALDISVLMKTAGLEY